MLSLVNLFELSNLRTKTTNIGTAIWIESSKDDKKLQHDIRLKAMPNSDKIVEDQLCDVIFNRSGKITEIKTNKLGQKISGKNLRNLQKWIYLNIDILILHWSRQITYDKFKLRMKPIKEIKINNMEAK
jgi:hypothetical protein